MKKKLLAKIFIPIIALGILVAPISPILKVENNKLAIETKIKKAQALTPRFKPPVINITKRASTFVKGDVRVEISDTTKNDDGTTYDAYDDVRHIRFTMIEMTENDPDPFSKANFDLHPVARVTLEKVFNTTETGNTIDFETPNTLKPNTFYAAIVTIRDDDDWVTKPIWKLWTYPEWIKSDIATFKTLATGDPGDEAGSITGSISVSSDNNATIVNYDLQCNPLGAVGTALLGGVDLALSESRRANLAGCIAELTYTLWEVSVPIANLAGSMLDFFVYYSISNGAYESVFLTTAWGTIRDVANIFFIIALLFVAIKTILNLNVSNQKRLIGAIIIAALLINFSFFITEVVIDASNILAKVFYNQIQSSPGNENQVNLTGATPITEKIVANLDPQSIVGENVYNGAHGRAIFIFITFLALGITLWMAWIFISVAFIFVARIISLWLCIIFSPIAFASFSLPFKIPGVGHQDWLDMLLKNAFLAPIFIFFLYIVILFTESFPQTLTAQFTGDSSSAMSILTKSLIPILLCFILLTKGKKLAVQYSGEMGKTVTTAAAFTTGTIGVKYVGGFLANKVGAAGRATVGRAGSALANSKWAKTTGIGRVFGTLGKKAADSSFNLYGSKTFGKAMGGLGMGKYVGTSTKGQGGYEKAKKDKIAKRQQRAQELKVGGNEPLAKELRKIEQDLQGLLVLNAKEINSLDKQEEAKRRAAKDAVTRYGQNSNEAKKASVQLENIKAQKFALRNGENYKGDKEWDDATGTEISTTTNAKDYSGNVAKGLYNGEKRTIASMEIHELADKKQEITMEDRERMLNYAKGLDKGPARVASVLFGSNSGLDEAIHKITMDMKMDSGK